MQRVWVGLVCLPLAALVLIAGARAVGAGLPRTELSYLSYAEINPDIFLVDVSRGMTINFTQHPDYDGLHAWSPDGQWLAFTSTRGGGGSSIFLMNSSGGEVRRLTDPGRLYDAPRWTNDGRILFLSRVGQSADWFIVSPDGSGFEQLAESDEPITGIVRDLGIDLTTVPKPTSRHGDVLQARFVHAARDWLLFVQPDGDRAAERLLAHMGAVQSVQVAWAPAGDQVAFVGRQDGMVDVYLVTAEGAPQLTRLTSSRAVEASPVWRPAG